MTWREGDTTSTIYDVLRDEPAIVSEIAAECGIPREWLTQIWRLAEPPADSS